MDSRVYQRGRFRAYLVATVVFWALIPCTVLAQYSPVPHRELLEGEIPVDKPGNYGEPGATYVLTKDISSTHSGIFLGKDVTLDLNGYTLTYADGNYSHLANAGFEEGEQGWDLSGAPGARVVNTRDVHIFMGEKLLSLKKGDEVVSEYLYLPESNRSYYAMCGITGHHYRDMDGDLSNEMKISLYVEDEDGKQVRVTTSYGDSTMLSTPVERKSPRLGGGFIVAHLNKIPAGKYRIRIKAETDCLIDEVDIRPAMDVGVGIVEKTHPMGHYDHLYAIRHSAFFDYTEDPATGKPIAGIPVVKGKGSVTIKNGVIKSGTRGVLSWGVQSTAPEVKVILDNVMIHNQGINATAVDVPQASITRCTFEVDNPFIINRHGAQFYAVDLRGPAPSEVSYSEFYGGQGCLVYKGKFSAVHHNKFVNKQMVTNHYSIMAMGDSSQVFENVIEPETGSGIEIFRNKGIEIFNNLIRVEASPPTCEYGSEEYSVAAIRIADYHAEPGAPGAAGENKIYNNTIYVRGRNYPGFPKYTPMAWAIYYSASGGENYVFGNRIFVDHLDPETKADAAAFYICGGVNGFGGVFSNNIITTNVPAAWIASRYGGTANTLIANNLIRKAEPADRQFPPFRMGWSPCSSCYAKQVSFRSNTLEGFDFSVDITEQEHDYQVFWNLEVTVNDVAGNPVAEEKIDVLDPGGNLVAKGQSGPGGKWAVELLDHSYRNGVKTVSNVYTVNAGTASETLVLDQNTGVVLTVGRQ